MSPAIDLVSFVSERSRRTIRSRRRRLRCPCQPSCELQEQNPPLCSWMLRAAKSLAAKCQDRASRGRVEKRAGAIERCKRAPNVLDADFGRAQLGINQRWRKSTGDIVSSKPEMKAGPRHFWARNQFSDHASPRRAARPYARRTCNYDPLTGFRVVNRSGEDAQGSSKNPQSIGLTTREGSCTDRSRSPPFCESASEIGVRASRITRTDRTDTLHTRGSQRQGLAAFPSS